MEAKRISKTLPESISLFLDFIRLGASLLVVVGHISQPRLGLGYRDVMVLGNIAVPVFFVLSGFVIRFVTRTRESNAREYFIDRASRIYSVVIPAMLFTLLVSLFCFLLDRNQFVHDWGAAFDHPLIRLLLNLVFFSQAWGMNTIPFLNSPFWSLGYECIYYVLFGFLLFFRGWKRIAFTLLVAVAIGPQVLFLFPIWWLGCFIYDFYDRFRRTRVSSIILTLALSWLVLGTISFVVGERSILIAPLVGFNKIAYLPNPLGIVGLPERRATMFAWSVGIWSTLAFIPLLFAIDLLKVSDQGWMATRFRKIANGTFVIYLMHYPFLVLLRFLNLQKPHHLLSNCVAWTVMCACLIAAAEPTDRLKLKLRTWLRSSLPGTKHPVRSNAIAAS